MKVLVIAPNEAPNAQILYKANNEISAIVNTLHPDLLSGDITISEFINKVKNNYDIIWFVAHLYKEGIVFLDGYLDAQIISQSLRDNPPDLIVFNTCDSLDSAIDIHNELGSQVVCTVADIEDTLSFSTGKALAANLLRYETYYEAYKASLPGENSQYRFIGRANRGNLRVSDRGNLEDKVQLLERIVGYDPFTENQSGLYKKVEDHDKLIEEQKDQLDRLGSKQDVANLTLFAILILVFFITVGLFFLVNYMYTLEALAGGRF